MSKRKSSSKKNGAKCASQIGIQITIGGQSQVSILFHVYPSFIVAMSMLVLLLILFVLSTMVSISLNEFLIN